MKKYFSFLVVLMAFLVSLTTIPTVAFASEDTATKYEAENGSINNAQLKSGNGGYAYGVSGTGFVGGMDYEDSSVTFTVTVPTAGNYELYVKYATDTDNATFIVYNYNNVPVTVNCSIREGWGSFNVTSSAYATIDLKAGSQQIKVVKGNQYAELDYIAIGDNLSGSSSGETTEPTSWNKYEAENYLCMNARVKNYSSSYSGNGFVGDLDGTGHYVDIVVNAPDDGTYAIKVFYATGTNDNSLRIFTGKYGKFGRYEYYGEKTGLSQGGWGEFSSSRYYQRNIGLVKGENYIRLEATYVEIDYIELSNKIGDFASGKNMKANDFNSDLTSGGYVKCVAK